MYARSQRLQRRNEPAGSPIRFFQGKAGLELMKKEKRMKSGEALRTFWANAFFAMGLLLMAVTPSLAQQPGTKKAPSRTVA